MPTGLGPAVGRILRAGSPKVRLAGAAVVAALALGTWVVLGTSALGVGSVEVSGSFIAGPDQVRTAAGVPDGTPLFRVDLDEVAERVRAIASVAAVEVSRSWPHTLRIDVTERIPVAAVAVDGGFAVLDADGVVFDTRPAKPEGPVLLKVPSLNADDPTTRAALRVAVALTPPLREQLGQLVADTPNRIRLELTDGRTIVWGDAQRSDVKAMVAAALLNRPATTIDVSSPDVATTS
jgi:cell division protein FtsQ